MNVYFSFYYEEPLLLNITILVLFSSGSEHLKNLWREIKSVIKFIAALQIPNEHRNLCSKVEGILSSVFGIALSELVVHVTFGTAIQHQHPESGLISDLVFR